VLLLRRAVELRRAPRALINDFLAARVFHLLPFLALVACTQTANAQTRFAVELANVDTGRFDTHLAVIKQIECADFRMDVMRKAK
jgi:hypothetical protein